MNKEEFDHLLEAMIKSADGISDVVFVTERPLQVEVGGELKPFKVFGPTCDTLDVLPRPLLLPKTLQQDDYIVFENMGAYSVALRTGFNGFYPNDWVVLDAE